MEITQDSNTERDGIRCAALVGANTVESDECPACLGEGVRRTWDEDGEMDVNTCCRCDGTGRIERIAPTAKLSYPDTSSNSVKMVKL